MGSRDWGPEDLGTQDRGTQISMHIQVSLITRVENSGTGYGIEKKKTKV